MRKRFSTIILLASGILGVSLTSCRSTDTESNLVSGGPTTVTFNLAGTAFSDQKSEAQASVNGKGIGSGGAAVQKHVVMVNPSTMMVAELSPASDGRVSAQASVGGAIAAIPGNALGTGIQFRVIAYSQSDGSFQAYQDYTVGQQAVPMMLNVGASYNMVVYSYGTTTLPAITSGEQTNINNAQVNYDDVNRDFMYYNQSNYIPVKGSNVLNITLRHKVAQITTIIQSVKLGDISAVNNAVLTPHYSDGIIPLSSGSVTSRNVLTTGVSLQFSGQFPATTITADPVFLNADTSGNANGLVRADITIGGKTITKNLANSFKITPGFKSNLKINLQQCGAYVAPGEWKEFMCHNLGADDTADPFTPTQGLHGAKYQWGAQTGEAGRYLSAQEDQTDSGTISGWNPTAKSDSSWSDAIKGPDDPCPTGYKVPTVAQWTGIRSNNQRTRIGTFTTPSPTNYSSAYQISSNVSGSLGVTMILPFAGYRSDISGTLSFRGVEGNYWSSSSVNGNATFLKVGGVYQVLKGSTNTFGYSVRCIAE